MRREDRWGPPDRVALMELEQASCGDEIFDREVAQSWDAMRPNAKNLRGVITPEKLARDQKYLQEIGENFEPKTLAARRLEYCLMEGLGSYNWFGENVEVVPTNRFDDVKNGTDLVVCFNREKGSALKLAVDVTTSPSSQELRDKVLSVSDDLRQGYLPHVDYFYLSEEEEKGRVYLPRVVIGTEADKANDHFSSFCAMLGKKKELGPQIARDNFQRELLKQIRRQLAFYLEDTLEALDKYHGLEHRTVVSQVRIALAKVENMELDTEIESPEFKELCKTLGKNREELFRLDARLANNIFKHLDILDLIEQLEKEKSSQGIAMPGAANHTEEMLEIKKSSYA